MRPEWLTAHVYAVPPGPVRLGLRRREARRDKAQRRRAAKRAQRDALLGARNACVQTAKRAKPAAGLRTLRVWGKRPKLEAFVPVALDEGPLTAPVDTTAQTAAVVLEGGYVVEPAGPPPALDAQTGQDRSCDRHEVEQDFRTMQTGLLGVRPLFVRTARRTRAPVWVTMLALQVVRERRRGLVAACGTTDDDKRAVTVEDALRAFARLCLLTYHVQGTVVTRLPPPDARQKAILDALGTP